MLTNPIVLSIYFLLIIATKFSKQTRVLGPVLLLLWFIVAAVYDFNHDRSVLYIDFLLIAIAVYDLWQNRVAYLEQVKSWGK